MKNEEFILGVVVFFVSGLYVGLSIEMNDFSLGLKWSDFSGAIATLVAAYAGAHAAFYLSERKRKIEAEQENIANANKFLANLYFVANELINIQKQWIEPNLHLGEYKHLFMQSLPEFNVSRHDLSLKYIDFSYSPEHMEFLVNVNVVFESYRLFVRQLNDRSDFRINKIDQILAKNNIVHNHSYKADYIVGIIGESCNNQFKSMTDDVVHVLNSLVKDIFELKDESVNVFKSIYPNAKLIDFAMRD